MTIMGLLLKPRSPDHISDQNTYSDISTSFIERGDVKICRVHTDDNVADPLTKPLPQSKHDSHTRSICI